MMVNTHACAVARQTAVEEVRKMFDLTAVAVGGPGACCVGLHRSDDVEKVLHVALVLPPAEIARECR